jgi:predicted dehydrogenase
MHHDCVVETASAGVHILCEKPLALTERECDDMLAVARRADVRVMTAYRLHFEVATLKAIELVRAGRIGRPRFFSSTFSMQVEDPENIRLQQERGGGPLYDLGIYCINAARSLFRDEPTEVMAMHANSTDHRFREVEEMTFAMLRFPGERMATFGCSFGAADTSAYHIVGTKGDIRVDPAYEYAEGLELRLTVDGKVSRRRYAKRDQFAPEILYFSNCVLHHRDPEPSGVEGLADVRVIEAIFRSAARGTVVEVRGDMDTAHPAPDQELRRPAVREPELVDARSPGE